ncbi:hypothetical protein [Roseibium aggregatum]|nr:hypothetical protein [Roseibium aggregatum]
MKKRLPAGARAKALRLQDKAIEASANNRLVGERHVDALQAKNAAEAELRRLAAGFQHAHHATPEGLVAPQKKKIQDATEELDRLESLKAKSAERANLDMGLFSRIERFLRDTPGQLREVSTKVPRSATVESVRKQLAEVDTLAHDTERAPAPVSGLRATMVAAVDAIAEQGAPEVDPRIRFRDPFNLARKFEFRRHGNMAIGDYGAHFFVWLLSDEIKQKLSALIPDDPDALSDEERTSILQQLAERRLNLERIEEALIEAASAEGRAIPRRPDASVEAILGIEVLGMR